MQNAHSNVYDKFVWSTTQPPFTCGDTIKFNAETQCSYKRSVNIKHLQLLGDNSVGSKTINEATLISVQYDIAQEA